MLTRIALAASLLSLAACQHTSPTPAPVVVTPVTVHHAGCSSSACMAARPHTRPGQLEARAARRSDDGYACE